jgi:hypothetical protein
MPKESSFTEILAQLEHDAEFGSPSSGGIGVVKGHIESSDAWSRPDLGDWRNDNDDIRESERCQAKSTEELIGGNWK